MYMSVGNIVKLDLTNIKGETPYPQGFRRQGGNYTEDQGGEKQRTQMQTWKKCVVN